MKTSAKSKLRTFFAAAALMLGTGAAANANEPQTKQHADTCAVAQAGDPDFLKMLFADGAEEEKQDDKERLVRLNDEVNDATVDKLIARLQKLDKINHDPIEMRINSPGGDVSAGLRLYDVMKAVGSPIHTVCEGECASMAAVLLAAGDTRSAWPSGVVMIHELSGGTGRGKYSDLKGRMHGVDIYEDRLVKILSEATGLTPEKLADVVRADTYYTAEEALAKGLIDKIDYPAPKKGVTARHKSTPAPVIKFPQKGH